MCQYVRMRDVFIKKVWYPFGVQCCGVERGDNHVTKVWMSVRMFFVFFFFFFFFFFLFFSFSFSDMGRYCLFGPPDIFMLKFNVCKRDASLQRRVVFKHFARVLVLSATEMEHTNTGTLCLGSLGEYLSRWWVAEPLHKKKKKKKRNLSCTAETGRNYKQKSYTYRNKCQSFTPHPPPR